MGATMNTILLVEDEEELREIFAHRLSDDGFKVIEAVDGLEALEKSREHHPDLIISDILMPNMNGIDFFTELQRESAQLAAIPFIFLTAMVGEEDTIKAIGLGVDGYLAKPVKYELLLATIKSRLRFHERQRGLFKSKLEAVFSPLFKDSAHAVGEYESLDVLFNHYADIIKNAAKVNIDFKHVQDATFRVRTLEDAHQVSAILAGMCPEPEVAILGILEMIVNGIEHGNLGIGYDLKTKLLEDWTWTEEVARRLDEPENCKKFVTASIHKMDNGIRMEFLDCGKGFDYSSYTGFSKERLLDLHGRGIAVANNIVFSELEYIGSGNKAIATIRNK